MYVSSGDAAAITLDAAAGVGGRGLWLVDPSTLVSVSPTWVGAGGADVVATGCNSTWMLSNAPWSSAGGRASMGTQEVRQRMVERRVKKLMLVSKGIRLAG